MERYQSTIKQEPEKSSIMEIAKTATLRADEHNKQIKTSEQPLIKTHVLGSV